VNTIKGKILAKSVTDLRSVSIMYAEDIVWPVMAHRYANINGNDTLVKIVMEKEYANMDENAMDV
jgi:hypothetical protein